MNVPSDLIDAYFDGTIDPEGVAELELWLRESPEHRRHLLRRATFQQSIEEDARRFALQPPEEEDRLTDPVERFDRLLESLEARTGQPQLQRLEPRKPAGREPRSLPERRSFSQPDPHAPVGVLGVRVGRDVGGVKLRHLAAAVVLLGVCLGLYAWIADDKPNVVAEEPPQPAVEPAPVIEDTSPVVWGEVLALSGEARSDDGVTALAGAELMSGLWVLDSGFMEVITPLGARVMVQAPSRFELTRDGAMILEEGRLSAFVPEPATGFTVHTPAFRVVDLGTEFGVDVTADGRSTAAVFEGLVELHASPTEHPDRPEIVRLREGFQSELSPGQSLAGSISANPPDPNRFVRDWWQAMYQPKTDDACVFLRNPPNPIRPNVHESDTTCFMLLEATDVVLPRAVPGVVHRTPEPSAVIDQHPTRTLPAGTLIDSYLIHFDPLLGGKKNPEGIRLKTTIRLPRPVVGLILDTETLYDTDALVGGRGYATEFYQELDLARYRLIGLDAVPEKHRDYIALSEDRLAITLDLTAIEVDQLRVWIEPAPEHEQPETDLPRPTEGGSR